MAPETRRGGRRRGRIGALVAALLAGSTISPPPAAAAEPWWLPLGLQGQEVTEVAVAHGAIAVRAGARTLASSDGGVTFHPDIPASASLAIGACTRTRCAARRADGGSWSIEDGHVTGAAPFRRGRTVPGAPDLGAGAHLIAAPAASPDTLVAVSDGNTVWRGSPGGGWGHSLLLLPNTVISGTPRVTSIAAFDEPLTAAVYLGLDGYAVLVSNNGGDDWVRAGPGLPDRVLALTADAGSRAVYAGTADGLWVHHVQRLPAPPDYSDSALWWRWLGVVLISVGAVALGWTALRRALPRPAG